MTFGISGCMYSTDKISVSILTFSRSGISKKTKPIYLTLTFDLESQGQTHFYMTFVIFGCIHDTDLILVSILTNSRSVISEKNKIIHMTLTVDLQIQGQVDLLYDLLHFWLYIWYRLDLCVDFIVFDATNLAVIKIFQLTSKDDLENQGQSYLLWPLVHHGLYTW